ncbi:MAG: DUF2213 domain-containing protein [candidate division Zixibacteria bacterium]|nr:DUF2213 domain-containing protein [candidate division Zixibacteria bacterium]
MKLIFDTLDFKPTSREYLDNGFLRVRGNAARTGVYQYLARELNLTDREPDDLVGVLRPSSEVFNDASLETYSDVDVTNDHPDEMVDSKSFKKVSVGHVVSASRDGDFVNVEMIIKDAAVINDIERGKIQLSPGYTAVYVDEKGTQDGLDYEFKQTDIIVNHVAIVTNGRGGNQVKLHDKNHNHGVKTMIKIALDSGRSIEIEDSATAALVEDSQNRLTKRATDAEAKTSKAEAEKDMAMEELEKEKKKSDDSAISKRVSAIAATFDSARKIAGKDFTCDSMDIPTIQRAALTASRDGVNWGDKDDIYVQASFDIAEEKEAEDAEEKEEAKDSYRQLANDASHDVKDKAPAKTPYQIFKDSQTNAHKGEK